MKSTRIKGWAVAVTATVGLILAQVSAKMMTETIETWPLLAFTCGMFLMGLSLGFVLGLINA